MHITKVCWLVLVGLYDKCAAATAAMNAMTCLRFCLGAGADASAHINSTQNELDGARAYRTLSLAYIYTCTLHINTNIYIHIYILRVAQSKMQMTVARASL